MSCKCNKTNEINGEQINTRKIQLGLAVSPTFEFAKYLSIPFLQYIPELLIYRSAIPDFFIKQPQSLLNN